MPGARRCGRLHPEWRLMKSSSSADRRLSGHALDIPVYLEEVIIRHARAVLHHDLALLVFDRPRKGVIRAVDRAGDNRVGLLAQRLRHGLAIGRHRQHLLLEAVPDRLALPGTIEHGLDAADIVVAP